jgi:acetyl-CoA carboxylase carboxyltransferase component
MGDHRPATTFGTLLVANRGEIAVRVFRTAVTVSWPTGEFGGMGLECAVRLGFCKELEAIADPRARERRYEELVAQMYERRSALNTAMALEVDDVIDPADTRDVLLTSLPAVTRDGWTNPRLKPVLDAP